MTLIKLFTASLWFGFSMTTWICSNATAQDTVVIAIKALTDPANIATLKDPRACNDRLLKVVYWLHTAQTSGIVPEDLLDTALAQHLSRDMVKESLLRNLVIASRLGLTTPENLNNMRRGRSPVITLGPYAGERAEVDHILPLAKYPHYSKEFWNLEIMPQSLNRRKGDKVGQRQLELLQRIQAHLGRPK